jgi:hypothetical protein
MGSKIRRAPAPAYLTFLAVALCSCGGGGAMTTPVAFTPPPPPSPSPTPTPTPAPTPTPTGTQAAPATPQLVGNFPVAVAGEPTLANPPQTALPLLQTVNDTRTMNEGASLTLLGYRSAATFDIANTALQTSNVPLETKPNLVYYETSGSTVVRLDFSSLDWTAYGWWYVSPNASNSPTYLAAFVTGFATAATSVPTTGSATYQGYATGEEGWLSGKARLDADFGSGTITGALTDMVAGDWDDGYKPWNSVSLSASIAGGTSSFAGTTAVTSAPANDWALGAGATGTIVGNFFGPNAEEIGAVWTLFDGTHAATGALGAGRQGP